MDTVHLADEDETMELQSAMDDLSLQSSHDTVSMPSVSQARSLHVSDESILLGKIDLDFVKLKDVLKASNAIYFCSSISEFDCTEACSDKIATLDPEALIWAWEIALVDNKADAKKIGLIFKLAVAISGKRETFEQLFVKRALPYLQRFESSMECQQVYNEIRSVVLASPNEGLSKLREWITNPQSRDNESSSTSADVSNMSPLDVEVVETNEEAIQSVKQSETFGLKLQIVYLKEALESEKKRNDELEKKSKDCVCSTTKKVVKASADNIKKKLKKNLMSSS